MNNMRLNKKYLNFMDKDKFDETHKQLLIDIYYFYYGLKINKPCEIKQLDNDIYNVSKTNLYIHFNDF
jgi:hypothetical protein